MENKAKSIDYSFNTRMRNNLSEEDLIDLGLIRNPIYDNHEVVKEIKQSLSNYQDIGDELGIEYAWALTADDEPTAHELAMALDENALINIRDEGNPKFKRSNFRYVEKQRNEANHYTRYILANGSERIIYDDELQSNPRFAYQRNLSDAREDGDFDEYNRLKNEWKATKFKSTITTNADTIEQCRLKVGTKLYGDVINIPNNIIISKDKNKLISYLAMLSTPIKQLQKLNTKIKLINTENKCLAIL